jgi:manganese transport protein
VVALALAGLANAAMLTVAATVLHPHRKAGADTLSGAHHALHDLLGAPAATAFALALLAAGLASSSVGVCAGDAIMRGFLRRRIHPLLRRLAGLVPALALLACGIEPTRALLLSQAALCFGVPCALIPLTWLTGKRSVTGPLANRPLTTAAAGGAATLISALNLLLLMQFLPR